MMRKANIYMTVLLSLCTHALLAQSIERQVIGSTGATLSNGSTTMSFTIGEVATTSLNDGTYTFNQGFQQGEPSGTLHIKTENRLNVTLYPNPTKNAFYINGLLKKGTLNIYDVAGKKVLQKQNINDNQAINISELSAGVYLIHIKTDDGSNIKRLVVE